MATSNAPNGLTSFGVPVMPGLPAPYTGNYYFVDPDTGSDGYEGTSAARPFATLYQAYSKVTSGNNDVIFLIGNGAASGTARLSTALAQTIDSTATSGKITFAKDAMHLIGVASAANNSRARIAPPSGTYTVTTFGSANMVEVTGNGCSFLNISIFGGFSTGGASQITWKNTGSRNYYGNCQIQGLMDAGSAQNAGSRSLLVTTGGENVFDRCIIGGDTVTSTVANASLELAGATPRNTFRDCMFPRMTSSATSLFVLGTGNACVDRTNTFENCSFVNAIASTSTQMTVATSFTTASPGGLLLLKDCMLVGATKWGDANALANSYLNMPVVSAAAGGLGLAPS